MKKFLIMGLAAILCLGTWGMTKDLVKTHGTYAIELDGADSMATAVKISIPFAKYRSAGQAGGVASYDAFVFDFGFTGMQDSTAQLDSVIAGENLDDSAIVKLHARIGGLSYLIDSQLIADPGTTAETPFKWSIARDTAGSAVLIESDSTWVIRMAEHLDVTLYYMDTAGTSGNIGAGFGYNLYMIDEDGI